MTRRRRRFSIWRWVLGLVVAGALAGLLAGGFWFYGLTRDLPSLEAFENLRLTATSTLYDRDGSPLATISSVEDGRAISRSLVRLEDVSPAAAAAVVFSEDRRFFQHYGIDFIRLAGALYNVFLGDLQGGSTITTQVVKNTLLRELANQRALTRKAKEFPLALELERRYSKEEILEMYLNVSFWGGSLTGIQAASQAYFGKNPAALSLAEGAYLAVLIPGPNPRYRDLAGTRERMKRLLDAMVAEQWVSVSEAEAAWKTPLVPRGWQARYDAQGNLLAAELTDPEVRNINELNVNLAPYFVLEVKRFLVRELGREKVFGQGGLRVYTTLDQRMQAAAEGAAADAAGSLPQKAQLALTALDPQTGEVLAMLGANHATLDEYNRATRLTRSPGSSVKPFVYALAIHQLGWTQASTVLDAPVSYPDKSQPGGVWRPKNFSGTFLNRPVTLRYALDRSLNLPAIRTAEQLGPATLAEHLKRAGFSVVGAPSLANAIGGGLGISPTQLSAAYAAFVNGGYRVEPIMVTRVEDAEGQILYQASPAQTTRIPLYTPQVAYLGWDMLKGYIYDLGTASLARKAAIPGRLVGGKTGTTDYAVDLWFAGASRGMVAALWIGRDDNKPMKLANGAEPSSSSVNPPIFRNFAEKALRGRQAGDFAPPPQVYPQMIDLQGGTPGGKTRMLFAGTAPPTTAPDNANSPVVSSPSGGVTQTIPIDRITGCLATDQTPPELIVWQQVDSDQIDNFRCTD